MILSPLSSQSGLIADGLFGVGAVKFREEGFRLKLHDEFPDRPYSPHFFNLRTPEHPVEKKRGPVTLELVNEIGAAIAAQMESWKLRDVAIAAVPHGAVPYGRSIARHLNLPFVLLRKQDNVDGTRRVIGVEDRGGFEGETVILVEDVMTSGASTGEAIEVCTTEGLEVWRVFTVMDREQGGPRLLSLKHRVDTYSLFTYTTMMDHLLSHGDDVILSQAIYDKSRAYHLASQAA